MSGEAEKIILTVEEMVKQDVKKEEEEIKDVKKSVADMESKKNRKNEVTQEEANKKAKEEKARIEAEMKAAEDAKKKEEERKNEEAVEAKKKEKLQKKEEDAMEAKMTKWLLEEEKGEEELRQLMNHHPEQFQNVDPFFFSNTLQNMQSTIQTQKALKKVRMEEAKKNADAQRVRAFRKGNNPFGMRLF